MGLILALMEVTKVHNMKSYKRISNEGAIHASFGEYNKLLMENYGLFTLDASYLSSQYDLNKVLDQVVYYGGDLGEIEVVQLLSDDSGQAFVDQVVYYMENQYGLDYVSSFLGDSVSWEGLEESGQESTGDLASSTEGMEELKDALELSEEEGASDLLGELSFLDASKILNFLMDDEDISRNSVNLAQLPTYRSLNVGYGSFTQISRNDLLEKALLVEYALEKLSYASVQEEAVDDTRELLLYQVEYLIGKESADADNLLEVLNKIILIRTPLNYTYLLQDSGKQAQAHTLATTLSVASVGLIPEAVIHQALLWAWSYGESIMDAKSLLEGYGVPLVKSSDDWQLALSAILNLKKSDVNENGNTQGLKYKDYLRILLYLEGGNSLSMRILDMIELTMQEKYEEHTFRVDQCVNRMHLRIEAEVGLGYTYRFPLEYSYK